MAATEFHYKLPHRAGGARPGYHSSRHLGDGVEFYGHASLLESTDPRRFDALASMRDPFGGLRMRVFRQRGAIAVHALVDVSASMGLPEHNRKLDLAADFVESLGFSAYRTGDAFSCMPFDSTVCEALVRPSSRARIAGMEVGDALRAWRADGSSSLGLEAAAARLPRQSGLVFLISDFHFPLQLLDRVLAHLSAHDLVPVVVRNTREQQIPAYGLFRLQDSESGQTRTLLMRPALRRRIEAAINQRQHQLEARFSAHDCRHLSLVDQFDAQKVTEYFLG